MEKHAKVEKPRLQTKYQKEVIPAMLKKHGFTNVMAVPKIVKVVVNAGLGDCKDDTKKFENAVRAKAACDAREEEHLELQTSREPKNRRKGHPTWTKNVRVP